MAVINYAVSILSAARRIISVTPHALLASVVTSNGLL
jgi:hypothetical protein